MKSRILFFSLALFTSTIIFAQTPEFGEEGISKEGMPPIKVIGESKGNVYVLKGRYAEFGGSALIIIEKYSGENLHLDYSNEIKMPKTPDGKQTEFHNIFLVNGRLLLVTTYNKDLKGFTPEFAYGYFVSAIGDDGLPAKEALPLFEIRVKTDNIYQYNLSEVCAEDNSQLFVYHTTIDNGKLRGMLIDGELNITKDIEIELTSQKEFAIQNFTLNANHFYYIQKELLPKSEWFSSIDKKYTYSLNDVDLKSKKTKKADLPIGAKQSAICIQIDIKKDALFVTGNHINAKSTKAPTGGCFLVKYNLVNLEKTAQYDNQIPPADLKRAQSPYELHTLYDSYTKEILEPSPGEFIVTTESESGLEILVQMITPTKKNRNSFIKVAPADGKSFAQFYKNDKVYLLCTDSRKNIDLPEGTPLADARPSKKNIAVVLITVEKDGTWRKEQLFSDIPDMKELHAGVSISTAANKTLVFTQRDKKVQFLTIKN